MDCRGWQEGSPEEVGRPQDHVLEVFQGQPPVVVPIGLIQHLLAHQAHLLGAQLPPRQLGHRLLQVPHADVIVVVEVCTAERMEIWGRQTAGGRQARPAGAYLVSVLRRRKLRHWREPQALRGKLGLALNWAGTSSFIRTFNKYLLSTYDAPGNLIPFSFIHHSSIIEHLFCGRHYAKFSFIHSSYLLSTYVPGTMIPVFHSFTHLASIYVMPTMSQAQETDGELNRHCYRPGSPQRESQ